MSFVVGGSGGITFVTTDQVSSLVYDPVVGTSAEFSGRLFYEVLPDIYHLLSDYDVLPEIWESYVMLVADLLQTLLCAEAGDSLLDIPIDYQRKYAHIDFDVVDYLNSDPQLVCTGKGDEKYVYQPVTGAIQATWMTKLSNDTGAWPLRYQVDQRTWLSWAWQVSYTVLDSGSYGFVGYFNSASVAMENSLLVGVGNGGRIGILHISSTGEPNFIESPVVVPLNTVVGVTVDYSSQTSVLTVGVNNISTGAPLLDGFSYSLLWGPHSELFEVDSFGLINLNTNQLSLDSYSAFVTVLSNRVVGTINQVFYMDPSLGLDVQEVPFLQDRWKDPMLFWENTVDYDFVDGFFALKRRPASFMLAEYISYDKSLVKNNFGLSAGLDGFNTDLYKSQVQALHSIYWKGPSLTGIRLGIQILLGLPFAAEAGEVTNVNPVFTGDLGVITIKGDSGLIRTYPYPREVSPLFAVGDTVDKFDYLTDGVEVIDWKTHPEWFKPFLDPTATATAPDIYATAFTYLEQYETPVLELHKYHMFMVSINSSIFNVAQLAALRAFLDTLKPTWKGYVLDMAVGLADDVTIVDEITVDLVANIWDHGGGSLILVPKYGAPGWAPYTYQYANPATIQYGMYHDLFPDDPIEVVIENVSGVPKAIFVGGILVIVPPGGIVTENIP